MIQSFVVATLMATLGVVVVLMILKWVKTWKTTQIAEDPRIRKPEKKVSNAGRH